MKIRSGFVSNSSSSSFVGYGVFKSDEELYKALKDLTGEEADREDWDCIYDKCENARLRCVRPYEDSYLIGLTFSSMKDDETKKEFFERIFNLIEKTFGTQIASDVDEQDVAWRDG